MCTILNPESRPDYTLSSGFRAQGVFLNDTLQQQKTMVNCMAINEDGVMATGGDDGSLWCGAGPCEAVI